MSTCYLPSAGEAASSPGPAAHRQAVLLLSSPTVKGGKCLSPVEGGTRAEAAHLTEPGGAKGASCSGGPRGIHCRSSKYKGQERGLVNPGQRQARVERPCMLGKGV